MKNVRTLFWRTALRDLRSGSAASAMAATAVREERLRAVATLGAAEDGALALSSWRGRSGRRYVVAAHPLARVDAGDCDGAVLLAVARDGGGEGTARIVATATGDGLPDEARRRAWLARAARLGAGELHVHRLAETAADRRAVRADLGTAAAPPREDGRDARDRRGAGRKAQDRASGASTDAPRKTARAGGVARAGLRAGGVRPSSGRARRRAPAPRRGGRDAGRARRSRRDGRRSRRRSPGFTP